MGVRVIYYSIYHFSTLLHILSSRFPLSRVSFSKLKNPNFSTSHRNATDPRYPLIEGDPITHLIASSL